VLAERAVEVNRGPRLLDAVLGHHHDLGALGPDAGGEDASDPVELAHRVAGSRVGRAESLEVAVEVRQVDQAQAGPLAGGRALLGLPPVQLVLPAPQVALDTGATSPLRVATNPGVH
jgi:hypothetical protein